MNDGYTQKINAYKKVLIDAITKNNTDLIKSLVNSVHVDLFEGFEDSDTEHWVSDGRSGYGTLIFKSTAELLLELTKNFKENSGMHTVNCQASWLLNIIEEDEREKEWEASDEAERATLGDNG